MQRLFKFLTSRVVLVALAILVQLGWLIGSLWTISQYHRLWSLVLVGLSWVLSVHIAGRQGNSAFKLSWIILILSVPFAGIILYLLFGRQRLFASAEHRHEQIFRELSRTLIQDTKVEKEIAAAGAAVARQVAYIRKKAGYPVYADTATHFLPCGEEYFPALIAALKKAERFIFLEYFIIEPGYVWDTILEILKEKAKAGVEVRVLYDDVGCIQRLPMRYPEELESYGIACHKFNPFVPFISAIMNHRDHRKIVVIDGCVGFTGGINLADEYMNRVVRFGHWKDTGVMLEGEAVWNLTVMFLQMWNTVRMSEEDFARYQPELKKDRGSEKELSFGDAEGAAASGENRGLENENACRPGGYVQPFCDNPLDMETVGENIYLNMIYHATRYVYIATPYLLIDNEMMTALTLAAKSGVDVRIMMPHIPDKKLIFLLSRSYYGQLLEAGVRIYEYLPGFLHSKTFLVDDELAVIGTINLDYRSLYLHFECGTFLYRAAAVGELKKDYLETMAECSEIDLAFCRSFPFYIRALQRFMRLFAPLF